MIKDKFPLLKNVYTRADKYEGDVAISSHRYNKAQFEEFCKLRDVKIGDKKFSFSKTEGEALNEFWQQ